MKNKKENFNFNVINFAERLAYSYWVPMGFMLANKLREKILYELVASLWTEIIVNLKHRIRDEE